MAFRDLIPSHRSTDIPIHRTMPSLATFQNQMNRLFDDFFEDGFGDWTTSAFPAVDVIENEKDFKVKVEIPGLEPENLDVSVSEDVITIKGEKKEEAEEKDRNYIRRETSYGFFHRTIPLPSAANGNEAQATFRNGLLTIDVPKKADAMEKAKKLEIKKTS